MKSKRKEKFITEHLNFPYIRKNKKMVFPVNKMSKQDIFFLKNFNFYNKNIDFEKLKVDDSKLFYVEKTKTPESTIDNDNPNLTRLLNCLEEIREFNNVLLGQLKKSAMTSLYIIGHLHSEY
jgi:hypothetical protein